MKMQKKLIFVFAKVLFMYASLVEGESGTICRDYSDISDAETCSGQTIYVKNNPSSKPPVDCVAKSKVEEILNTKFRESYTAMEKQLNGLNDTVRKIANESLMGKSTDFCTPNPCGNNGVCISGNNDYACKCPVGFEGNNCSTRNLCFPNPCQNNGICTSGNAIYQCKCQIGYEGSNCAKKSLCAPNPCENNGTCLSDGTNFACICLKGYEGNTCNKRNLCYPNPCKNNGACTRGNMTYHCLCPEGYGGENCTIKTCSGGLTYGGQRIKLPRIRGYPVKFSVAKQTCADLGSRLAEITNHAMYLAVKNYIASTWQGDSLFGWATEDFWLGSKFEQPTNNTCNLVSISNGMRVVLNGTWVSGFPKAVSSYQSIIMVVSKQTTDVSGIKNSCQPCLRAIPLCACDI